MKIRILLVDDHQIVLKGLAFYLGTQADFELVGEAHNGREAIEQVEKLHPDLVLMDLNMPEMDGIEASSIIAERFPDVKVLVLTSFSEPRHIYGALRTGVIGYMLKDAEPEQLALAIRSAHQGNVQLHPEIRSALVAEPDPLPQQPTAEPAGGRADGFEALTPRELEVLRLITKGCSNKEIAQTLVVSEKTVKSHVSSILSKLHLTDRTQAALYAVNMFPA
ncbi:response regulator [Paenibacillus sp. HJGM_3]|uniref:response regulator n=1 Tax=Paenibacillus sp. HJGM_3 TaxID=3379816 RepID=UPI00385ED9C8